MCLECGKLGVQILLCSHELLWKIGIQAAILSEAWCFKVNTRTIWSSVSTLLLHEVVSFICNFYLSDSNRNLLSRLAREIYFWRDVKLLLPPPPPPPKKTETKNTKQTNKKTTTTWNKLKCSLLWWRFNLKFKSTVSLFWRLHSMPSQLSCICPGVVFFEMSTHMNMHSTSSYLLLITTSSLIQLGRQNDDLMVG